MSDSMERFTTEQLERELARRKRAEAAVTALAEIRRAVDADGGRGHRGRVSVELHIDQWRAFLAHHGA